MIILILVIVALGLLGWYMYHKECNDHTATVDAFLMERAYIAAMRNMLERAMDNDNAVKCKLKEPE